MKKTILLSLLVVFILSIIPGTTKACDKQIKNPKSTQKEKQHKK